jgi:hypothetical protein
MSMEEPPTTTELNSNPLLPIVNSALSFLNRNKTKFES